MISELVQDLMAGGFAPKEDEGINDWAKRVAKSIKYDKKMCGKTKLSPEDIKYCWLIAMATMDKVIKEGFDFYDPRTGVTLKSNETNNG